MVSFCLRFLLKDSFALLEWLARSLERISGWRQTLGVRHLWNGKTCDPTISSVLHNGVTSHTSLTDPKLICWDRQGGNIEGMRSKWVKPLLFEFRQKKERERETGFKVSSHFNKNTGSLHTHTRTHTLLSLKQGIHRGYFQTLHVGNGLISS